MDKDFGDIANRIWDKALYLQLTAAFDPSTNFEQARVFSIELHDQLRTLDPAIAGSVLPRLEALVDQMVKIVREKFAPIAEFSAIATSWNDKFRNREDPISYGVEYGWLAKLVDLRNFLPQLDYVPFHFRVGVAQNKGHFSIEEEFLLSDAFNQLVKGQETKVLLMNYAEKIKAQRHSETDPLSPHHYSDFSQMKFEIAAYARTAVISFYSFVECFVNSVGHSHLCYNSGLTGQPEAQVLSGRKGKYYIPLREKMKEIPRIVNPAPRPAQKFGIHEQRFFDTYEDLRNSAVHYSPQKASIWLKPDIWLEKADEFSRSAIGVAHTFWDACFPGTDGPQYLGKLEYDRLYGLAKTRYTNRRRIEAES